MPGPGIPPGPWDPGPLCDAAIAHPDSQSEFAPQAFQVELKKAVRDFRREWLLVVVCLLATAIVVAALMAYLAISLQRHDLQQLATQKDKLTAEVSALQEQAEARRNNGRKAPK